MADEAAIPENQAKSTVKLSCKQVWKVFGDDVESLFASNGGVNEDALGEGAFIRAVSDASFDVYDGEIFVIMGLSGSGKSTLLRCMTRLIEPSAGEIYFESQDLMKVSEAELIDDRFASSQDGDGVPAFRPAAEPHRTWQRGAAAGSPGYRQGGARETRARSHRTCRPGRS
jgi:energy-coupling factor transporter ATP-binding protein EcfA2